MMKRERITANIDRDKYSLIMETWDTSEMMQYSVPVSGVKEKTGNVKFYWNTDSINFKSLHGKEIVKKLREIGVDEKELERITNYTI